MKTLKQAQREARQLFQSCLVDGLLDEARVRQVVQQLVGPGRTGALTVASRFERLVKRDRARHKAEIASAVPLPDALRAEIEASLARRYGAGLTVSFVEDPTLIGGLRLSAGSDVYDGSVKGGLATLETALGIRK
jgi:F-type H+-transporting ATPase subunit delta